jgi:hypothetical protein
MSSGVHSGEPVRPGESAPFDEDQDEESILAWILGHPKKVLLGALILVAVLELIPVWLLQTNPRDRTEPVWDSARTASLAHRSCFDCHSNATEWPWYSKAAPMSWVITWDVVKARQSLNLSQWNRVSAPARAEAAAHAATAISSGEMPPGYYTLMHPQAALTASEQQDLITGLLASFK